MRRVTTAIVESIAKAEGSYWDDPIGGPTNYGITQRTLTRLREKHPSLPVSVKDLDPETAKLIIEQEYIVKRRIHELPERTALIHAHMSVMSWNDGIEILQKRLGVPVDGIIGPVTLKAARSQSSLEEVQGLVADVDEFVKSRDNRYAPSYETRLAALFA